MKPIEYEGDKNRVLSGKGVGETMNAIMNRRFSRRAAVAGSAAGAAVVISGAAAAQTPVASPSASPVAGTGFTSLTLQSGDEPVVPDGYTVVPFLRWGDPLFADSPAFDAATQSAASQAKQVGYNCDYIGWISLPLGSGASDNGLLVVNHEYTNPELMFAGYLTPNPEFDPNDEESAEFLAKPTQDIVDTELEAHGMTIVEVKRGDDGQWAVVTDSQYNRRITGTTTMELSGPVAGHDLAQDHRGRYRHRGHRHAQQLRRRHHAVGHGGHW